MNEDLPNGWALATLSQIARINPRHPKGLDDRLPVSFAPMAALSEDKPTFQYLEERSLGEVRKGFTHFAERDVLFAKITPCMENGKGAVATHLRNGIGCATTEVHIIRPFDGINSNYIYRFLAQPAVRQQAKDNFTGTAGQARVPLSFIEELEIPLAPAKEQKRIAAKLESVLAKVKDCEDRLAQIRLILKRFRQSVLAAACSGRLTVDVRQLEGPVEIRGADLPAGWKTVCIGDVITDLKYGTSQKCSYEKRGTPVLRIPNVANGRIDRSDLKFAVLSAKERQNLRLQPGDVLVIRSNGSVSLVGRSAVVREAERNFAYAGYLIRLRPERTRIDPEFLNIVLGSYDIRLQIELEARSTSGVNNINSEEIRSLRFGLPTLVEQREIIRKVGALSCLADQLEARYLKANEFVGKLTQSILAMAFRGKLVTIEAEIAAIENRAFESAEELLARVQAEGRSRVGTEKLPKRASGKTAAIA